MIILKILGYTILGILVSYILYFIWDIIGLCLIIEASKDDMNVVDEVLDCKNPDVTTWRIFIWPVTLYRMLTKK